MSENYKAPWKGEKWRMKDAAVNASICNIIAGNALASGTLQNMVVYQYEGLEQMWVSELMVFTNKFEFVSK